MAKPQMMVVVKVQDHDELQSIQIYPISSDSCNEKVMVASYEFQGRKTCGKIMIKYPGHRLPKKFNNSEVLLPDDELCPRGWNNIVLKFIDQTTGGSTSGLPDEEHCIEIDHPYKSLFPVIREVLEDLSTDVHWENHEEMAETYESPAYPAYEDELSNKKSLIQTLLGLAEITASALCHIGRPLIISEDQPTELAERGTRVATSSCEDIEEACAEVSELKKDVTFKWYCCNYNGFQDYSAEVDTSHITNRCLMFQTLDRGDGNHKSVKGVAKVVMGVSATASCGSFFALVKAAYAAAFIASLIALWLPCKWKTTTRVLTKFGAIACAAGVLATLGYELPPEYIWMAGLAFIVPAAAVALS